MTRQPPQTPEDAMEHEIRQGVIRALEQSPGQRTSDLAHQLNVNRGTIKYHLSVLERLNVIESHRVSKFSFYFIRKPWMKLNEEIQAQLAEKIFALRRRGGMAVVHHVRSSPGIIQKRLEMLTGLNRKVLRSLLDTLVENGLVIEKQKTGTCQYHPTEELDRLLEYLGEAPPEE